MKQVSIKSDIFFALSLAIVFFSIALGIFSMYATESEFFILRSSLYTSMILFLVVAVLFRKIGEKLLIVNKKKYILHTATSVLLVIYISFIYSVNAGYARLYSPVDIDEIIFYDILNIVSLFMLLILSFYTLLSFTYLIQEYRLNKRKKDLNDKNNFSFKKRTYKPKKKKNVKNMRKNMFNYDKVKKCREAQIVSKQNKVYVKPNFIKENDIEIIN